MSFSDVDLDSRDGSGTIYDGLGRPLEWRHKNVSTGATVIGFEYAYDRAGNRLMQRSIHDPLDSQRYAYDSASRLVATSRGQYPEGDFITSPSLYCESPTTATWTTEESAFQWGLDGAGNWDQYDTWKNAVETDQTRTDTNFNEIHQVGATTLTHNDNGDMTYDGSHQYKWDAFGRLREVRSAGGTLQATYYYDADHRRVRKDFVSGTDLDFLYDGWRIIEHRTVSTQLPVGQYVFGNYLDELIEADINGGTLDGTCTGTGDGAYFATQNALFSVYAMTRGQNSIHTAYSYDPYGGLTRIMDGNDGDITVNFNGNDTRTINATSVFFFCYTGQMFDNESGLLYYKRRYYHPTLGRFISRDPMGLPRDPNLYQYVGSRPSNLLDPLGLDWYSSMNFMGTLFIDPSYPSAVKEILKHLWDLAQVQSNTLQASWDPSRWHAKEGVEDGAVNDDGEPMGSCSQLVTRLSEQLDRSLADIRRQHPFDGVRYVDIHWIHKWGTWSSRDGWLNLDHWAIVFFLPSAIKADVVCGDDGTYKLVPNEAAVDSPPTNVFVTWFVNKWDASGRNFQVADPWKQQRTDVLGFLTDGLNPTDDSWAIDYGTGL
jgi:RHS repeat-associated protein